MPDLLMYLLRNGVKTEKSLFPQLDEFAQAVAGIHTHAKCSPEQADGYTAICPTSAISAAVESEEVTVSLDQGRCIACGLCMRSHPEIFRTDRSSSTARTKRGALVQTNRTPKPPAKHLDKGKPFRKSFAIRVVSTGCASCDLELGAAGNPIFDMERFGVQVVASPRAADGLLITGPVPKAMHAALLRTYEAMAEPRIVIAAGTCAISGGLHSNGYAEANGVAAVLPVDVFIPGCPPHPWNLVYGISLAMGNLPASD